MHSQMEEEKQRRQKLGFKMLMSRESSFGRIGHSQQDPSTRKQSKNEKNTNKSLNPYDRNTKLNLCEEDDEYDIEYLDQAQMRKHQSRNGGNQRLNSNSMNTYTQEDNNMNSLKRPSEQK